jgi:hypothetical protein
MPNEHLSQRLSGIQGILMGVHRGSTGMPTATTGDERESFIRDFLSQVLPLQYRFGTGTATDSTGGRSGQLDVVVEFPFMPSLPMVQAESSRLYLAEGIAAVIEVKSNISSQWGQAVSTATQLEPLRRSYDTAMYMGPPPTEHIPLFIAAYTGWSKPETVAEHLDSVPNIEGILIIDSGIFCSSEAFGSIRGHGHLGLWALICCLHQATSTLKAASTNPINYAN